MPRAAAALLGGQWEAAGGGRGEGVHWGGPTSPAGRGTGTGWPRIPPSGAELWGLASDPPFWGRALGLGRGLRASRRPGGRAAPRPGSGCGTLGTLPPPGELILRMPHVAHAAPTKATSVPFYDLGPCEVPGPEVPSGPPTPPSRVWTGVTVPPSQTHGTKKTLLENWSRGWEPLARSALGQGRSPGRQPPSSWPRTPCRRRRAGHPSTSGTPAAGRVGWGGLGPGAGWLGEIFELFLLYSFMTPKRSGWGPPP